MLVATPGIHLRLLDGFELTNGSDVVSLPPASKRLLAFLALQERPVLRAFVAGTLWTDMPEARAEASLRSALWRLRRPALMLVQASATLAWLAPHVKLDVREMTDTARRLVRGSIDFDLAPVSPNMFSGDLLPDWYDDWLLMDREQLRQIRLHALEALSLRLADAGYFGQAVEAGLCAVAGEPLRESAHRSLVRAFLAEGNQGEALRQYHTYRRLLWNELRLEPSAHMEQLVRGLTRAVPSAVRLREV